MIPRTDGTRQPGSSAPDGPGLDADRYPGLPRHLAGEYDPEHLAGLLFRSEHAQHHICGIRQRPCADCRLTAPLGCVDPERCGTDHVCRPCAATHRCRMWHRQIRRYRIWFQLAEGLPELLKLPKETGAELVRLLGRVVRRVVRRALERERRRLAAELPDIIRRYARCQNTKR
jgi:hypothetical protein